MNQSVAEEALYQYLARQQITYQRFEHAPVYTCEQACHELPHAPGAKIKNLLLVSPESGRLYLMVAAQGKKIHFKKLAKSLGEKSLRFASQEQLLECLGVEQGAVTLLGIINDHQGKVVVLMDRDLENAPSLQCHPLVNTATLVIPGLDVTRFLTLLNHPPVFISGFSYQEAGSSPPDP